MRLLTFWSLFNCLRQQPPLLLLLIEDMWCSIKQSLAVGACNDSCVFLGQFWMLPHCRHVFCIIKSALLSLCTGCWLITSPKIVLFCSIYSVFYLIRPNTEMYLVCCYFRRNNLFSCWTFGALSSRCQWFSQLFIRLGQGLGSVRFIYVLI